MIRTINMGAIVLGLFALTASAQAPIDMETMTAFREYATVGPVDVEVPTVVSVPVSKGYAQSIEYLVMDAQNGVLVQSRLNELFTTLPEPYTVSVHGRPLYSLTDRDRNTGERYEVGALDDGLVTFEITTTRPITASRVAFIFDKNVALPTRISISSLDQFGNEQIVHRQGSFLGTELSFIPTTAQRWRVTLTHAQPLMVNEVIIADDMVETTIDRGVRFLAQPGGTYIVYRDAARNFTGWMGPQADLQSSEGVVKIEAPLWSSNPQYTPSDSDADSVPDTNDNCVQYVNPDQLDTNQNGRGDVCDDHDRDGYINTKDNCPNIPNYQSDEDGDGIGDECDAEESRLTERLPWVPWVGMGIAGFVVLGLFIFVAIDMRNKKPTV